MPEEVTSQADGNPIMELVSGALARWLRQQGRVALSVDPDVDLIDLGLVDSQVLLDIILDVEQRSGRLFDAERLEFESAVTLRRLAASFAAPA